ncbi:SREC protein, partial [Polypterus senegalus]
MDKSFECPYWALTVDDVYDIAKSIGAEVEKLLDNYGKESVEGLVPKTVKVLELLEHFAARNRAVLEVAGAEHELLRAFGNLHAQPPPLPPRKSAAPEDEEAASASSTAATGNMSWSEIRVRGSVLPTNRMYVSVETVECLALKYSTLQKEREIMLKLKGIVDKQRDEIRAQGQEIGIKTKEVEALQEQLDRFMKMNSDLRHKQSIAQAQVTSASETKANLEADLEERQKEIARLRKRLEEEIKKQESGKMEEPRNGKNEIDLTDKMVIDLKDPNRPCFTKQEVKQILIERNELKANLFLVQEELSYYQREILNDERYPGFLMEAFRSAIKRQRKKIKAKMLGIPEEQCSSDDEQRDTIFTDSGLDCTDSGSSESRIQNLCGYCKHHKPCDPKTGSCVACELGWNGTLCNQLCPAGRYGENCNGVCRCRGSEVCNRKTGTCLHCNPGWSGPRCDSPCPAGSYGNLCRFQCQPCYHGSCDSVTGHCICDSGYQGDRSAISDAGPMTRMKHHVICVIANLSSAIPCFVLGSSTWPRVTVAHHDADVTFNHSFIEPPSAGWVSENSFSSFETDEEGPVYCIPPKEGDGAEFQEMASKCNIFPDVSSFNAEDVSQAFPIPRTSSIAKSKRPSVSFAEGTKFGPEERRGSATEMFNILRTSKMLWVTSKLSTIQSNTSSLEGEEPSSTEDNHHYEDAEMPDANLNKTDPDKESKSASIGGSGEAQSGRRRTMSNAKRNALPHQAAENTVSVQKSNLEKISTVYVTLGKAVRQSKASSDSSMEGPVQSVLRRLGSLQRQKEDSPKPSGRGDNIIKPPRRKLGARAGLWEQALAASAAKGLPKQKTQVRHSNKLDCSVDSQEGTEVRRPLMSTSILKNTVMSSGGETREKSEMENGDGAVGDQYETHMECSMASNINLSDQGAPSADEKQTLTEDEGPKYENVDPRDIKCASYTTEG